MRRRPLGSWVLVALVLSAAVLGAIALLPRGSDVDGENGALVAAKGAMPPAPAAPPRDAPGAVAGLPPQDGGAPGTAEALDPLGEDPFAGADNGWAKVDMEAVRAAMPDNLYWTMSVPTKDPDVLAERERERARWNVEYGKVLSNTATEEEIHAYFEHTDRLASDYIQFITHILENYGEDLTLRDIGLLKVAAELNLGRLEEIPRQMADALERRKAHEAAREAWLRDQEAFAAEPGPQR
jgi:hypothetical protein